MNKLNRGSMINLRGIAYDVIVNSSVFFLCHFFFDYYGGRAAIDIESTLLGFGIYLLIYILLGLSGKMYDLSTFFYRDRVVKRVLSGCLTASAVVTMILFFAGHAVADRDFYLCYFLMCLVAHMYAAFMSFSHNRQRYGAKKTLFVGTKADFNRTLVYISKTNISFDPVGYVKLVREGTEDERHGEYLGYVSEGNLEQLIREMVIDQVYIMQGKGHDEIAQHCVDLCVGLGVVTRVVQPMAREDCSTHIGCSGTYPVVSYHLNCLNPAMNFIKRVVDVIGATVGIVLSSPILLLSIIAIKLDSDGPAFFQQTRVGQNGRRFKIYKLRTMTVDAEVRKQELLAFNEVGDGLMFKMREDPRVTRVGAFLRRTSIDEIPQFFNVLAGDMSLVGTRPPTEEEVSRYEPGHWRRLRIKPGITGLWQISGRSTISDFNEIVALDTKYIENWTIATDFGIMLRTVAVVLHRKGAY